MSLNSYYIQFVLNSENHYSKNKNGNKNYNNIVACNIKTGQISFDNQQLQFYNIELPNGWYYNIFAKSQINFISINTNNLKSKLTKQSLKQILYRDYFLRDKKDTNNVYFNNYILTNIIQENDQFKLQLQQKTTNKNNKIYGIVQCVNGCNGLFTQKDYVYKTYEIIQLNNNVFELLQKDEEGNYKNFDFGGQINIDAIKYDNSFLDYMMQTQSSAYKTTSDGKIRTLLVDHIYETLEQAKQNKPQDQYFHQELFQRKQIKRSSLGAKVFDTKKYVQSKNTKLKIEEKTLNENKLKKITDYQIIGGFVGGYFEQVLQFDLTSYKTNNTITNGFWYIKDDDGRYYGAGLITNSQYVNMPNKIFAKSNDRTAVTLYYYSINKVENVDYNLSQNSYLKFYSQLNKQSQLSNTNQKLTYPNGCNLTKTNDIDVIQNPYISTLVSAMPFNKAQRTISFLTKLNSQNKSVLFSTGCPINRSAAPFSANYDFNTINTSETPYQLQKYYNIQLDDNGNICVNKYYCNYTLYQDGDYGNYFDFSSQQKQTLITTNIKQTNKKSIVIHAKNDRCDVFVSYYIGKYCQNENGYYVSTDNKVRFKKQLTSIEQLNCANKIKQNKDLYPYGSTMQIMLGGQWIQTLDCIVSKTNDTNDIFCVTTQRCIEKDYIINARLIDEWYFVQLKYDGVKLQLCIDNNIVGEIQYQLDVVGEQMCMGRNIQKNNNTTDCYIRQIKIFNAYLTEIQSKQQHMLAYYNCLYNNVETPQINYNFINNNQIKVKYEINVKNNDGKIKTFYNWLNHTPKNNNNLCIYPIDVISNNIIDTQ